MKLFTIAVLACIFVNAVTEGVGDQWSDDESDGSGSGGLGSGGLGSGNAGSELPLNIIQRIGECISNRLGQQQNGLDWIVRAVDFSLGQIQKDPFALRESLQAVFDQISVQATNDEGFLKCVGLPPEAVHAFVKSGLNLGLPTTNGAGAGLPYPVDHFQGQQGAQGSGAGVPIDQGGLYPPGHPANQVNPVAGPAAQVDPALQGAQGSGAGQ